MRRLNLAQLFVHNPFAGWANILYIRRFVDISERIEVSGAITTYIAFWHDLFLLAMGFENGYADCYCWAVAKRWLGTMPGTH